MSGAIIKKVRFAVDHMKIEPTQAASVASTSDEESSPSPLSSGDDVDMASPMALPPSAPSTTLFSQPALAHVTGADIKMDDAKLSAGPSSGWPTQSMPPPPRSALRALPDLPAFPALAHISSMAVKTMPPPPRPHVRVPLPPPSLSCPPLPPIPRAPRRAVQTLQAEEAVGATASSSAVPVLELDGLSITAPSSILPSLLQPIWALPSRAPKHPPTDSATAPSTQAGQLTPSPDSTPSPPFPPATMAVFIPPVPGCKEYAGVSLHRPMTREDIPARRDELLRALDSPDAVQKIAVDLWSNNHDAKAGFFADIAVEFRRAVSEAAAVGDMTSAKLNFSRRPVNGPTACIDAYHDAPIMEAFTKYYVQWVDLHIKHRRDMVAELILLRQMEGLDDLIEQAEGLDVAWMGD
ncbi:hypothetical protein BDN67DRAFT_1016746 [Paxillus ammoniavirescens]|nr:hypothetical protein BDN67DRAFT_1016746 [Paxillus ammoniavirescens]